jgi:hypothetical protein
MSSRPRSIARRASSRSSSGEFSYSQRPSSSSSEPASPPLESFSVRKS